MKRGIWYIILIGICVYTGILNRKEIYIYGAILLTAVMLFLWVSLIINCAGTKLALSIAIPVAEKNKPFYPAVEIRSKGKDIPYVSTCFKLIGAGTGKAASEDVIQIEPGYGKCQGEVKIPISGRYEITTGKVKIYDSLNIFYLKKRIKSRAYIYVLPECYTVTIDVTKTTRDFVTESDIYVSDAKGDDYTEAYQIREYQPGDRIMNINWKLSARFDELMVKDSAKPRSCPVVICMELFSGRRKNYGRQLSAALETMVSISYSLINVKVPHYIAWYDFAVMEVSRYRIVTGEDVYDAASKLSMLPVSRMSRINVMEEYKERFRGEEYTTMINIDMQGKVSCMDYEYNVTDKNLKNDIEAIYLRV